MEPKKSKKANLERSRGLFLEIGLLTVLSIILIAFEWTTPYSDDIQDNLITETTFDIKEMVVTKRDEPPPKPQQQKVMEIMNIVDDNVDIEKEFDFDVEANSSTEFIFYGFGDYIPEKFKEDEPFIIVEDMPTFNGGNASIEFYKYILKNLNYPDIAAQNGISGRVTVQFVVNTVGKVVDAKVVGSVDPALDKEALRVVTSSPLWTPGKQRGKPVKVLFNFPINFVLQ